MIVKRLLRFALGPSFLELDTDDDPEAAKVRDAYRDNRERAQKVSEAETEILRYIGLGETSGKKLKESQRDGSGEQFERQGREDHIDSKIFYIPTSFYLFYLQYHWPVSALRYRLQTFTVPTDTSYLASFSSFLHPISWNRLYGGLLSSGIHEVSNVLGDVLTDFMPSGAVRLVFSSAVWYLSYPLLEWSIKQMLGIAGSTSPFPPLREFLNLFSLSYIRSHSYVMFGVSVWWFIQSRVKQLVCVAIRLMAGKMRSEKRILLATHFLMEITSGALSDILCIPLSTVVCRDLAHDAGANSVLPPHSLTLGNWDLVLKASMVEWLVAWITTHLHDFVLVQLSGIK
ncbi:hypothetical protein TRICI_003492 [Trichomonascus ciferrii]|uniref:Uncharacterized protein n=1 Tax=Trichomonascus ciferrii TaxID=44093 RepID=A0A642V4Z0_9ASCO|nr:hypothetical protein TRICI_003492 [Trichomonascus ciferrii]